MTRLICLLMALAFTVTLSAQPSSQAQGQLSASATSTASCPSSGCVVLYVTGQSRVALQVTGTYSGTVSFEGSIDNVNFAALNLLPLNSATAASSTTSTGIWQGTNIGGLVAVRARMSSYSSGAAIINLVSVP